MVSSVDWHLPAPECAFFAKGSPTAFRRSLAGRPCAHIPRPDREYALAKRPGILTKEDLRPGGLGGACLHDNAKQLRLYNGPGAAFTRPCDFLVGSGHSDSPTLQSHRPAKGY